MKGIEPTFSAWEADVLPSSYTCAGGSERLVSLAMELHEKGLSWEAIAQQWNAESILMLTGGGNGMAALCRGRCRSFRVMAIMATKANSNKTMAQVTLRSTIQGAVTVSEYIKGFGDIDLADLVCELNTQTQAVKEGSL